MDKFGMINMNGRLYDPVTGQMLSPDNNVSSTFSQGFNRYTYCNNNPLKYIDPTGQTAIGGNSWNNYQNDFSVPGNPFIGGSYINQQEFLIDNGVGCFYRTYAFGGGWIYGNTEGAIHFGGTKYFKEQHQIAIAGVDPRVSRKSINYEEIDNSETLYSEGDLLASIYGGIGEPPKNCGIDILIWEKDSKKDLGHVAIKINGDAYGYFPTDENNNNQYDLSEALDSKGILDILTPELFNFYYKNEQIYLYHLKVTEVQHKAVLNRLLYWKNNPGRYSLFGNNCTTVAIDCLIKARIINKKDIINYTGLYPAPSGLGYYLQVHFAIKPYKWMVE